MFMLMVKDSLEVQKQRFQRHCVFVGNDGTEVARKTQSRSSRKEFVTPAREVPYELYDYNFKTTLLLI
jgi:hypothetical protein